MIPAHGQNSPNDTSGFLSIDCGLTNSSAYNDSTTGLEYVSDGSYVEGGSNHQISTASMAAATNDQERTLRSFPDGRRNCYTLPSTPGKRYLLRTTFTYGNYDGLNKSQDGSLFVFGLHIGVNLWTTVNLTALRPTNMVWREVLTIAPDEFISVCMINLGSGTPFVSTLEMRPLRDPMYPFVNTSVSVCSFSRLRFGEVDDDITRYPIDAFDRFWEAFRPKSSGWVNKSSDEQLNSLPGNEEFLVPSAILQRASTVESDDTWLAVGVTASGNLDTTRLQLLPIFHFAELDNSSPNRWFKIEVDGVLLFGNYSPPQHRADSLYHPGQFVRTNTTVFTLSEVNGSALPPLINAFEVYSLVPMDNFTTAPDDVNNMKEVEKHYNLAKTSWNGDPCSPREYSWEDLTCDYSTPNPRITQINLSANGLQGGLALSFMKMSLLEKLDLSHNNLTGTIPDFQLNSLQLLNLSNNQLDGSIPNSILQRYKAGLLDLRLEGNPICSKVKDGYCANKKNTTKIWLVEVIVPMVCLVVVICILWKLCWKGNSRVDDDDYTIYEEQTPLRIDIKRFTYAELKLISNNFQSIIGKGGFGTVYYGTLENGDEIAIKVLVETSIAESKDFLAEVQTLSKVHHKNLVALEGYCQNKKCLALVYPFMPRGSLHQLLRRGHGYSPNWEERLRIALDAAQGLEYLHESCIPSIVHRDVKTANILLDHNLAAKISDFGLSRAFSATHTHITTVAAGTLGYLDPEYHATFQLTVKTDVYSFGIVLLEIITSQPPLFMDPQTVHLPNWVRQKIATGSIHNIVDTRLLGQYDPTTLQSVIDLAMRCLENASVDRPPMTEVVSRLKACLPMESGENQTVSPFPRQTIPMEDDIPRQFQLMTTEDSTISNEGGSFQSDYNGGISELSHFSGR